MPTTMPESIQKGPFLTNLDNILNNPTTREQVRVDLQDWLTKPPDNKAFADLAVTRKVFTDQKDQMGGMTAAAARDHLLKDWLAPATFWPSVQNTAEILAQALLHAIQMIKENGGLPIGCLWSCHGTAEHVDVAVGVNGQQIAFIIHTNQPPEQPAGSQPQDTGLTLPKPSLIMVRNARAAGERGVRIVPIDQRMRE